MPLIGYVRSGLTRYLILLYMKLTVHSVGLLNGKQVLYMVPEICKKNNLKLLPRKRILIPADFTTQ